MKKTILLWSLIALASIVVAPIANAQLSDQTTSNLWDVVIRFCNENAQWEPWEMKSLFLEAESWEENDICIYINNNWPTDVDVLLNFVDWTVTADESQNKACQPEWTLSNFGQFVEYKSDTITVPAWQTVETHWSVTFPDWYAGLSYGCVTMQFAPDEEESQNSMFNVLSRRGYFIDFLVEGDFDLWLEIQSVDEWFTNIWTSNEFVIYKTDKWIYKWSIQLYNPWNVAQVVSVLPTLTMPFADPVQWRNSIEQEIVNNEIVESTVFKWTSSQDSILVTKKILPKQSATFEFEFNDAFPWRLWPMEVDVELTHTPTLDFINTELPPELIEQNTLSFSSSFFVLPLIPLIALIVCVLILLVIFSRRKK